MQILKNLFHQYYVSLLDLPYGLFKAFLGEDNIHWGTEPAFKITITLMVFFVILYLVRLVHAGIRSVVLARKMNKEMLGHDVREPYTARDTSFVEELDMAQHPLHTLAQLKKEKRYGRMGELYARLNQPAESARWFMKDGQYQRAAEELAKAGKTLKAARMLYRLGEYQTAARFFASIEKHKQAAEALLKGGDLPGAASACAEAGLSVKAAELFREYFLTSQDAPKAQEGAADLCYRWLQKNEFTGNLTLEQRNELCILTGKRFLASGRAALAATLFQEGGDTKTASEIYKRLDRMQKEGLPRS
ncbi:MAG TPA: hypothetical protein PLL36_09335 [Candidatus Hydrogenedentes bacterium]|nr:hypothetical protein [Candidatus Hydrogenedentota bacterium]HQN01267.1 hypothetical protein [Candidatus Hydrogenedentota bacterium]